MARRRLTPDGVLERRLAYERRVAQAQHQHNEDREREAVRHTQVMADLAVRRLRAELVSRTAAEVGEGLAGAGIGELVAAIQELTEAIRSGATEGEVSA